LAAKKSQIYIGTRNHREEISSVTTYSKLYFIQDVEKRMENQSSLEKYEKSKF